MWSMSHDIHVALQKVSVLNKINVLSCTASTELPMRKIKCTKKGEGMGEKKKGRRVGTKKEKRERRLE